MFISLGDGARQPARIGAWRVPSAPPRREVSAGLSATQVLPALAGALLGIPGGLGLLAAVDSDGTVMNPPLWELIAVVPSTLLVVAALTTIPARLGARRSVAERCRRNSCDGLFIPCPLGVHAPATCWRVTPEA